MSEALLRLVARTVSTIEEHQRSTRELSGHTRVCSASVVIGHWLPPSLLTTPDVQLPAGDGVSAITGTMGPERTKSGVEGDPVDAGTSRKADSILRLSRPSNGFAGC